MFAILYPTALSCVITLLTLMKTPMARMLATMPRSPVREAQMPIMVNRYTGGEGLVTRSRELELVRFMSGSLMLPVLKLINGINQESLQLDFCPMCAVNRLIRIKC